MSTYSGESNVYIVDAQEADAYGNPSFGYDLYQYLHDTQGVGPGPSTWYGEPGSLQQYVYSEEYQDLLNFAQQHLGPPNPGPTPTPTPTPSPPTPPSPAPSPSGQYIVADQAYSCPVGFSAITSSEECQSAAGEIDAIDSRAQVTAQSDPDDPLFCWAYGGTGAYTDLYMNAVGSAGGARPMRSALCKKDAPAPSPSPTPSEGFAIADQEYACPSGYEAIGSAEECKSAAVSVGAAADWWDVLTESDPVDPQGCWAFGDSGNYGYLYFNSAGAAEKTREQRSIICKISARVV